MLSHPTARTFPSSSAPLLRPAEISVFVRDYRSSMSSFSTHSIALPSVSPCDSAINSLPGSNSDSTLSRLFRRARSFSCVRHLSTNRLPDTTACGHMLSVLWVLGRFVCGCWIRWMDRGFKFGAQPKAFFGQICSRYSFVKACPNSLQNHQSSAAHRCR